ncbi:hypothetical protein [Gluconobacter kondonii]|uniref:hypothetical protein n=1 Tax=Gluconobacter kondonii TaxID=941463 RepID=UPI001B8CF0E5|nr:hypothetical protein [Gluconobacter kondonii]MBS1053485.1 hypothetical protein [Gluconobacter kondonii]
MTRLSMTFAMLALTLVVRRDHGRFPHQEHVLAVVDGHQFMECRYPLPDDRRHDPREVYGAG